ncbi:MAG: hypothetical protein HOE35_05305 [Candidatus Ruthia sp.]|jgi:hypothetical protein|nr:hypothetical protein [Candidatus Ruthturnera sp.]
MKTITNNSRSDRQLAILHLFEFDMYNLDGTFQETLRFTDHDIFVDYNLNDYTPLAITFDKLSEDFSMSADTINITIDNVNSALSNEALASEWRNNRASITRVAYTPPAEVIADDTYDYGIGDNLSTYPELDLDVITDKDVWVLFGGIIDTFSASEQVLSASITTHFANWSKAYPSRTYNQNEFTSIVDAINDVIYWGRQNT